MKMHPVRTAMSITAIVGSIVLMVAGLGVWDSLYDSYDKVYKEEFCYRYVGQVSRASYEELRKTFEEYNAQLAQTRSTSEIYSMKIPSDTIRRLSGYNCKSFWISEMMPRMLPNLSITTTG